ncbi:MAG: hypothetical protein WAM28_00935 [Chlamydiales bacterium]
MFTSPLSDVNDLSLHELLTHQYSSSSSDSNSHDINPFWEQQDSSLSIDQQKKIEEMIKKIALDHPDYGRSKITNLLNQQGFNVKEGLVGHRLEKLNLETPNKRLDALKEAINQGIIVHLTEYQKKILYQKIPTDEEIKEIVLNHPNYGGWRIAKLLNEKGFDIKKGSVGHRLEKLNLETLNKRLDALKEAVDQGFVVNLTECQKKALQQRTPQLGVNKKVAKKRLPELVHQVFKKRQKTLKGAIAKSQSGSLRDHQRKTLQHKASINEQIKKIALDHPDYGRIKITHLLNEQGVDITLGLVGAYLAQLNLDIFEKRLKALKDAVEQGLVVNLTEYQKKILHQKIPSDEQIKEIALNYPDYGSFRITTLLTEQGFDVKEGFVRSRLEKLNLDSLEKRQKVLKEAVDQGHVVNLTEHQQNVLKQRRPLEERIKKIAHNSPSLGRRKITQLLNTQGVDVKEGVVGNRLKKLNLHTPEQRFSEIEVRNYLV